MVTSCKRNTLDIICVVLGCDTKKDRTLDSIELINYTFNNFLVVNLKEIIIKNFDIWKNEHLNSFSINKGISSNLELYINENQIPYDTIAINSDSVNNIATPITFTSSYNAPLESDSVIGTLQICIDDKNYFSLDILNKNTVRKKNTFYYFKSFFENYFYYLITN